MDCRHSSGMVLASVSTKRPSGRRTKMLELPSRHQMLPVEATQRSRTGETELIKETDSSMAKPVAGAKRKILPREPIQRRSPTSQQHINGEDMDLWRRRVKRPQKLSEAASASDCCHTEMVPE